MYFYRLPSRDIRVNLATEQYLMNNKDFDEPLVLFYIQEPCIIIGRNQNPLEEMNLEFVKKQGITLTRRLSGGGAVYDDLGNVSFSFVVKKNDQTFGDFKSFTAPIVTAIQEMGAVGANVSGRNDLMIDGKKFSGNAMYTKEGKTFSHGTLMFDVNLDVLPQALTVAQDKILSKGTKSVRSHVTNLRPYLSAEFQKFSTEEFRDALLMRLLAVDDLKKAAHKELVLNADDEKAIAQLVEEIYGNDQWIYGAAPEFTIKKRRRIPAVGIIDARLEIVHGKIEQMQFFGDFFGEKPVEQLAELLKGTTFSRQAIKERIEAVDVGDYFTHLTNEQLVEILGEDLHD
ncbi:lipoate--protein ligase [Enterococcus timonensis]|uniref:lipoate--protein ligase n=1 Tax=Enterococcus timonensis TaxID=1852364 RepID=UPI0008D96283|nr:lipoate--protein ligase [Enterococcus timonensis]